MLGGHSIIYLDLGFREEKVGDSGLNSLAHLLWKV